MKIMKMIIYNKDYNNSNNSFMDFHYGLQMKFLASDLLSYGLSPKQVSDAIAIALKISCLSGITIRKHFMPVYSAVKDEIIQDCKLSSLGYGLVLMNANSNLSVVANFQLNILKEFIKAP